MLASMSVDVGRRLDWRMVPAEFTVILPHNCECKVTEVVGERPEADIVIRSEPFWKTPVSLQSRGCGEAGDRMEIPWSWVLQNYMKEENTTDKSLQDPMPGGKILSWQFLKLRFGVMSHSGFLGDPVYPPRLDSCSDNLDCNIEASKHETLCTGRSVREVIEDSKGFSLLKNHINRPNWETFAPEIKFVRQKRERIVIVMETAETLRGQWKFLAKAVKNLILHNLPEGSEVGLVTFSSSGRIEFPLTKLDAVTRARVADIVPDKYRLASTDLRCVECGLETALRLAEAAPSHLLLITSNDTNGHVITQAVMDYLNTRPARVSTLLLSSSPVLYYDTLARVSGGQVATMAPGSLGPITGYLRMMRHLQDIVSTEDLVTSHEAVVTVSEANLVTEAEFEVFEDSKDTEMMLVVEDVYSHLVRAVEFIEAKTGYRHGPFHNLVTSRAGVNMLSVYMSPLPRISPETASSWGYKILWYPPERSETVEAGLIVQTRTETGLYDVRLWTSSDLLTERVSEDTALILYASVTHRISGLPVLRARVTAHCKVANTEAGLKTCEDIELLDNGSGDPDITADDGVYSRYMIQYPGEGRYEFSVSANDDNNEAFIATNVASLDETLLTENVIEEECCGSRVNLFNRRIRHTGHFTATSSEPVVKHIIQVFSSNNATFDMIPPAQIGDLSLELDSAPGQLKLSFTAPGDDLDHGQATSYRVIASRNRNEMFNESLVASEDYVFLEFSSEKVAGQRISFLISFNIYNEDIFLGVIGVDEDENMGKMSNVFKVFMPRMEAEEDQTKRSPQVAAEHTEEDYSLVLALSGAIVFLISFLCLGILYFLKMLRSRKTAGGSAHDHVLTDIGSDDSQSPRGRSVSDHSSSLMSLGQSTPAYWSASDLLSKHESKLGLVSPADTPQSLRQWSVAPLARELFLELDSISEVEEEVTEESSDDGQHLESAGYRDARVQRIVSFNTNTFHHPRVLSLV